MKAYIVKRKGQVARAFIADYHIGLVPDPEEHVRMEAMEFLFEGILKKSVPKYKSSTLKNVTVLELEDE